MSKFVSFNFHLAALVATFSRPSGPVPHCAYLVCFDSELNYFAEMNHLSLRDYVFFFHVLFTLFRYIKQPNLSLLKVVTLLIFHLNNCWRLQYSEYDCQSRELTLEDNI